MTTQQEHAKEFARRYRRDIDQADWTLAAALTETYKLVTGRQASGLLCEAIFEAIQSDRART